MRTESEHGTERLSSSTIMEDEEDGANSEAQSQRATLVGSDLSMKLNALARGLRRGTSTTSEQYFMSSAEPESRES